MSEMTKQADLPRLNRELNRTILSHDDIGEARQYLQAFQALDLATSDQVVLRGLLTAAVVAYGRPFSDNRPHEQANPRPPLKLKHLFSPAQRKLHDKLINLRNEVVAHSDYERRPVTRVSAGLPGFSYWGANFDLLQQGLPIGDWLEMCNRLIAQCFTGALGANRDMTLIGDPSMKA
jgi:hypothetical protein